MNLIFTDPMASVINPAWLGFFSQKHNFGFAGCKRPLSSEMEYSFHSVTGGYAFKSLPVTVGIGYHRLYLDIGKNFLTDERGLPITSFHSYDKADILSASFLLDQYIQIGIGMNVRFIEVLLAPAWIADPANIKKEQYTGNVNACDYGISIQIPLIRLLSQIRKMTITLSPTLKPFLLSGLSYSVTNIGDEIVYGTGPQNALSRTAYLGFNTGAGIEYYEKNNRFHVIAFQWSTEVSGLMTYHYVNNDGSWSVKYRSGIFGVEETDKKYRHGWSLNILDLFYLRKGRYDDNVYREKYDTDGYGINFMQPLRLLWLFTDNGTPNAYYEKLLFSLDLEYHEFRNPFYERHHYENKHSYGFSIKFRNSMTF